MPADRLGAFYEGFASWRRMLRRAPPESQPIIFSNAVAEVAGYVAKGLDRIVAIDEIADLAVSVGWADVDRAQAIIAETFKKINVTGVAEIVPEHPSDFDFALKRDQLTANEASAAVLLNDFLAYMPQHNYIFKPTRETWPAASVNARVQPVIGPDGKSMPAAKWLDASAAVEQMTWAPGKPNLISVKLIADGGWIDRSGSAVFNLYRPPAIVPVAGDVTPWLCLVEKVFPDQAGHIISWLAHRVQRPYEKINHALVLGGEPGIGKDTILEPVKQSVGPWNFADVSPKQALGRFNGFLMSVILRISEARDLGDFDLFYDHMKVIIAAPPDVLRIDEKNLKEHYIPNLCGAVITTNHKTNGIYLPADDRRHMVAWSNLTKGDFELDYWRNLYRWYDNGGNEYVAYYLAHLDIRAFDPKEPPPKTQAFWEIVNANRAPEDSELADVLDSLGRPNVVTLASVVSRAAGFQPAFYEWLNDRRNRRTIPHRFEDCGYIAVSNPNDTEGRWKISGRRHTIYGKANLTEYERLDAAFKLAGAR
jgi:hypothetical protein